MVQKSGNRYVCAFVVCVRLVCVDLLLQFGEPVINFLTPNGIYLRLLLLSFPSALLMHKQTSNSNKNTIPFIMEASRIQNVLHFKELH